MDELLRKAQELGESLATHPRFKALIAARDVVRADEGARKLLEDYQAQVDKIHELTAANKPIEVEQKHRLTDLEQRVASNETIKQLSKAQVDFSELMSGVNRAIYDKIAPTDPSAEKTPEA